MSTLREAIDNFTEEYVKDALIKHDGKLQATANYLGVHTRQLQILRNRFPELEKHVRKHSKERGNAKWRRYKDE